jgi:hypothetical protein
MCTAEAVHPTMQDNNKPAGLACQRSGSASAVEDDEACGCQETVCV